MNDNLVEKLRQKRNELAVRHSTEIFKILHNSTIDEIARIRPKTLEELSKIKGIGPKKLERFGRAILDTISGKGQAGESTPESEAKETAGGGEPDVYTVGGYLDRLNLSLGREGARVRGEVGRISERESAIYFDLKDLAGGSLLSCIIFRFSYDMMGISLKEGMEVIVSGSPNIYKPFGKLSFRAQTVELVGEGKLKKAYEELKVKLEKEGLFAPERKRPVPEFARKVALITSRYGEAIHDFSSNLGQFGFKVRFLDSRVEGQQAVPDLVRAIGWVNEHSDAEVMVIIRGGGSWESLQAFNNEAVARAIAASKIPVLTGIGHEKDVPIACLVSDRTVSTPTATAEFLTKPWTEARKGALNLESGLISSFERLCAGIEGDLAESRERLAHFMEIALERSRGRLEMFSKEIRNSFRIICGRLPGLIIGLSNALKLLASTTKARKNSLFRLSAQLAEKFGRLVSRTEEKIGILEKSLGDKGPERQLKLGYSIVCANGKVIKDAKQLKVGQLLKIKLHRGSADSEVKKISD